MGGLIVGGSIVGGLIVGGLIVGGLIVEGSIVGGSIVAHPILRHCYTFIILKLILNNYYSHIIIEMLNVLVDNWHLPD